MYLLLILECHKYLFSVKTNYVEKIVIVHPRLIEIMLKDPDSYLQLIYYKYIITSKSFLHGY